MQRSSASRLKIQSWRHDSLTVGAKALAKRFAKSRAGYGALMLRGVEVGAAVLVMAFGVLLLTGTVASEHRGMF